MPIGKCVGRELDMSRETVLDKYRDSGEVIMKPCEYVAIKQAVKNGRPRLFELLICCPGCGVVSFSQDGNGNRKLLEMPD